MLHDWGFCVTSPLFYATFVCFYVTWGAFIGWLFCVFIFRFSSIYVLLVYYRKKISYKYSVCVGVRDIFRRFLVVPASYI